MSGSNDAHDDEDVTGHQVLGRTIPAAVPDEDDDVAGHMLPGKTMPKGLPSDEDEVFGRRRI